MAKKKKWKSKEKIRYLGSAKQPFKSKVNNKTKLEIVCYPQGSGFIAYGSNDAGEKIYQATAKTSWRAEELLKEKIQKGHSIEVEKLLKRSSGPRPEQEKSRPANLEPSNNLYIPQSHPLNPIPSDLSIVSDEKIKELYETATGATDAQTMLRIELEYERRFNTSRSTVIADDNDLQLAENSLDDFSLSEVKVRKRQAQFRVSLFERYGPQCMATGTQVAPVLEAAHIIQVKDTPDFNPDNGLILRADIHKLFDNYLLSINESYELIIDPSLRNTEYFSLNGSRLISQKGTLPSAQKLNIRYRQGLST